MRLSVSTRFNSDPAHQSTLPGSRKNHLRTENARERDPPLQDSCDSCCCIWDEGTFSRHVPFFLVPTTSMLSTSKIRLG